jgi:anti-sigma-K factor RskA
VLLDGALEAGDVIAVTVEPEGGAPDGQPTSDPIIAIPTA